MRNDHIQQADLLNQSSLVAAALMTDCTGKDISVEYDGSSGASLHLSGDGKSLTR